MAERSEHLAAFHEVVGELHAAAAANARALHERRGTASGAALERQLEHTLDRLALLYGRGTYENIPTAELFHSAIENEVAIAHARAAAGTAAVAGHPHHGQALIDAARRGVRLNVDGTIPPPPRLRGAYVAPLRREFEISLHQRREPYARWRDGVVAVLEEDELNELRAAGDEVDVLFLDPDELLDLAGRASPNELEAEFDRRLAAARAAADRIGDSRARHLRRLLLRQSTLLRNLRDRLAGEHPSAFAVLAPIVAANRALLETALVSDPPTRAAPADPLAAAIEHERALQALLARWTAEPDDAGLRPRFAAVAGAGTLLPELERHRR